MNYSRTVRDGAARDEALKRRSGAVRETLGTDPKPTPDAEPVAEPKEDEKPSE